MLDHMLDQLLFPLVLWPSFASAQNPFPLKYDTSAQGTWRDGLPMNIYMLWEFHEPRVQGTFRMSKPEHDCLPIPIYRLLCSFHHENFHFNGSFTKLRRWTIPRKQSCKYIHSFVNSINVTYKLQSLWPLSKETLEDAPHGCHPLPTKIQCMLNRQLQKLGFHGADYSYSMICGKPGNQASCTEDFSKEWCCAFLCFAKFCGNLGR